MSCKSSGTSTAGERSMIVSLSVIMGLTFRTAYPSLFAKIRKASTREGPEQGIFDMMQDRKDERRDLN